MKKRMTVLMVLVAFFAFGNAHAVNIGVFDAQEVLDSIEEGKKAVAELEKQAAEKKKTIEAKQKELEKMKKDLDSQALVMSKDALSVKEKEFQTKVMEFEQMRVEAQRDMQQKEMTATGEIFKKINAVIQKLGKDGNYDFILEKNQGAVTYFKSGDITDKVIKEYNKTYK